MVGLVINVLKQGLLKAQLENQRKSETLVAKLSVTGRILKMKR